MAFAPHVRVSAIGYLGSDVIEHFSYGFSMSQLSAVLPSQVPQSLQDIADDIAAFHGRSDSHIAPSAVLRMVKFAPIGADGLYAGPVHTYPYNVAGGQGGNFLFTLPQSALAITMDTDRRGPTGRGRFFMPMPVVSADPANGYVIDPYDQGLIRDSAAQLFNDVNNAPGNDFFGTEPEVVVASSKGYNTRVTSIRVGRVIDTIRTRRNQLDEKYGVSATIS